MKYINLAIFCLIASTNAIKLSFDESEGPTKADKGESDDQVLHASSLDHDKGVKWTNPLNWKDDGTDDDKVLTQSDGSLIVLKSTRGSETMPDLRAHLEHHNDLDNFYHPAVYGIVEDIYNTHHLELPLSKPPSHNDEEPDDWSQRYYFGQKETGAPHKEEHLHF